MDERKQARTHTRTRTRTVGLAPVALCTVEELGCAVRPCADVRDTWGRGGRGDGKLVPICRTQGLYGRLWRGPSD